jgi:hypothetical protein
MKEYIYVSTLLHEVCLSRLLLIKSNLYWKKRFIVKVAQCTQQMHTCAKIVCYTFSTLLKFDSKIIITLLGEVFFLQKAEK